jgi:hypothetical protein
MTCRYHHLPMLGLLATLGAIPAAAESGAAERVAAAEAAVRDAETGQALWTTAVTQLKEAKAALAAGRTDDAIRHADEAKELARLGRLQRQTSGPATADRTP